MAAATLVVAPPPRLCGAWVAACTANASAASESVPRLLDVTAAALCGTLRSDGLAHAAGAAVRALRHAPHLSLLGAPLDTRAGRGAYAARLADVVDVCDGITVLPHGE